VLLLFFSLWVLAMICFWGDGGQRDDSGCFVQRADHAGEQFVRLKDFQNNEKGFVK
jgi:hypothetical protein